MVSQQPRAIDSIECIDGKMESLRELPRVCYPFSIRNVYTWCKAHEQRKKHR